MPKIIQLVLALSNKRNNGNVLCNMTSYISSYKQFPHRYPRTHVNVTDVKFQLSGGLFSR